MTPEAERLIAGVPDMVTDTGEDAPPISTMPNSDQASEDRELVSALMAGVAFDPEDVQETLTEFFGWMAEKFQSDHWKLTDRQARMLGRPTAQLMNSLWARLADYLPDVITQWCDRTPGAMAFLMAAGMVVGPKVAQQISISRKRASSGAPPKEVPQPKENVPGSVLNGPVAGMRRGE